MNTLRSVILAAVGAAAIASPASALPPIIFPIDPPILILPTCPDPAAVNLQLIDVVSRNTGAGRVYDFRLVGTVRNVGVANWSSGFNQQTATIRRIPAGAAGGSPIGGGNFQHLAAGAQTQVYSTTVRGWSKSDEFPPSFELFLTYDPDITIDGNPANDDCRSNNNRFLLTGAQVNALLP